MKRLHTYEGFTMIEIAIVAATFGIICLAVFGLMMAGQSTYNEGVIRDLTGASARKFIEYMDKSLKETNIDTVCTSFYATPSLTDDYWEQNYHFKGCAYPNCPWKKKTPNSYLGTNAWFEKVNFNPSGAPALCPVCGHTGTQARLDGIKFLSPRQSQTGVSKGLDNTFQYDAAGDPLWQCMVFVFPRYDAVSGYTKIEEFRAYLTDLNKAGNIFASGGTWLGSPTLEELVGFTADTNGEYFIISSTMICYVRINSTAHKYVYLYIVRNTGQMFWYVYRDASTYRFTRFSHNTQDKGYTVLAQRVTDLAISTNASLPSAGIGDKSIRLTVSFEDNTIVDGKQKPVETILNTSIMARN